MHEQGNGLLMIIIALVRRTIDGRLLVRLAVGFNLIRLSLKLLSTIVCSQLLRLVPCIEGFVCFAVFCEVAYWCCTIA
jgi:uncharacterized membrane protein YesL